MVAHGCYRTILYHKGWVDKLIFMGLALIKHGSNDEVVRLGECLLNRHARQEGDFNMLFLLDYRDRYKETRNVAKPREPVFI